MHDNDCLCLDCQIMRKEAQGLESAVPNRDAEIDRLREECAAWQVRAEQQFAHAQANARALKDQHDEIERLRAAIRFAALYVPNGKGWFELEAVRAALKAEEKRDG